MVSLLEPIDDCRHLSQLMSHRSPLVQRCRGSRVRSDVGGTMRRLLILAVAALSMMACSSSDYDQPQPTRRSWPGATDDGGYARERTKRGVLDMLPPAGWGHQPQHAGLQHLTAGQIETLS